jgi:hypothetical protein
VDASPHVIVIYSLHFCAVALTGGGRSVHLDVLRDVAAHYLMHFEDGYQYPDARARYCFAFSAAG